MSKDSAEQFKNINGLEYFIETSAKNGFNTKNVFIEAAKLLYRNYLKYKGNSNRENSSFSSSEVNNSGIKMPAVVNLNIEDTKNTKEKKCSC